MTKYLALSAFFLSSLLLQADEPDQKVVAQEIAATIRAVYTPDYDLLLKHTHEEVLKLAGGEKAFKKGLKQTHEFLISKNVSIESVAVGKTLDYFETAENEFFFVATRIMIKVGEKVQAAPGHQLAVRKKDTKVWKYIDCSALNDELVRKMFPDFPKDQKLPNGK